MTRVSSMAPPTAAGLAVLAAAPEAPLALRCMAAVAAAALVPALSKN